VSLACWALACFYVVVGVSGFEDVYRYIASLSGGTLRIITLVHGVGTTSLCVMMLLCNTVPRTGSFVSAQVLFFAFANPIVHSLVLFVPWWFCMAQTIVLVLAALVSPQSSPYTAPDMGVQNFNLVGVWVVSFVVVLVYVEHSRREDFRSIYVLLQSTTQSHDKGGDCCTDSKLAAGAGAGMPSEYHWPTIQSGVCEALLGSQVTMVKQEPVFDGGEEEAPPDLVSCESHSSTSTDVVSSVEISTAISDSVTQPPPSLPITKKRKLNSAVRSINVTPTRRRKACVRAGCMRGQRGGLQLCIAHGGGTKCAAEGCSNTAKEGGLCKGHGGGKRCQEEGCPKSAQERGLCIAHGGGRQCKGPNCTKLAKAGGLCISHGGGTRCHTEGCNNSAQSRGLCKGHGGGKRCKDEGCNKFARVDGTCIEHSRSAGVPALSGGPSSRNPIRAKEAIKEEAINVEPMKKVQQMIKLEPMIKLEDPFTVEEAKALVLDRPNFIKEVEQTCTQEQDDPTQSTEFMTPSSVSDCSNDSYEDTKTFTDLKCSNQDILNWNVDFELEMLLESGHKSNPGFWRWV